jgi:hypothetical protein
MLHILATAPAFPALVSTVSWVMVLQFVVLPIALPVLVGLVSRSTWSTLVKRLSLGGLTLIGTLVTGIIGAATSGTAYDVGQAIFSWFLSWGVAELAYWKLLSIPVNSDGTKSIASVVQAVGDPSKDGTI